MLVVTSKVKQLIKSNGSMNTSKGAVAALSDAVEFLTNKSIEKAKEDGRKTVMQRDVEDAANDLQLN